MRAKQNSKNFLLAVLIFQFAVYITVFFDIPVARQVIGFIYFTFIPGFVIAKLLKLDSLDGLETLIFSVGLSIAFLMLIGLLVNEILFLVRISRPLSLMPLIITFNSFILIGGVLAYLRNEGVKLSNRGFSHLSLFDLLFLCLPILSVVGVMWMNSHANNVILLFMLVAIPSLLVIALVSKKFSSLKLYPFAVVAIAVSLLLHSSLVSNYIIPFGSDVPVEYFVFKSTQNNAYWSSVNPYSGDIGHGRIFSMLSVTILPTIYSNLLNIEATWVFKMLFPLIFSFVVLGLYQLWKGFVGDKYAFISTFLFMAYATFYTEMLGLNRQMVAELFFVLLLFVIMNNKMKSFSRILCYIFLSFGLVTSHYGLSEIFLFFVSLVFVSMFVVKRPSRKITASMIILFFVVMFTWYIYTSGSAVFDSLLSFGDYVYSQLGEFFNPASRGQTVLRGLGLERPPTIWNAISRAFAYTTQFLIVVGFLSLVTKRVKVRFESEYSIFCLVAVTFLAALILVPGLANTMNMSRFYHILLFFLAPLCVMGAEVLVRLIFKRKEEFLVSILLLTVLVPYFLFQADFVYELTGSESWSIPLSKYRMDPLRLYGSFGYIDAYSASGAQWLSKNVDVVNSQLYADGASRNYVLTVYGMIYRGYVNGLSNTTKVAGDGVVYLSTLNVVYGKMVYGRVWNTSELS
ncbi:MAG: DUF2206 domain-containing protein, partial [Candidatus Heimdallarchaeaceae archaeon]